MQMAKEGMTLLSFLKEINKSDGAEHDSKKKGTDALKQRRHS